MFLPCPQCKCFSATLLRDQRITFLIHSCRVVACYVALFTFFLFIYFARHRLTTFLINNYKLRMHSESCRPMPYCLFSLWPWGVYIVCHLFVLLARRLGGLAVWRSPQNDQRPNYNTEWMGRRTVGGWTSIDYNVQACRIGHHQCDTGSASASQSVLISN